MNRKRLKKRWLLPPVILAALFIWTVAGQLHSRAVLDSSELEKEKKGKKASEEKNSAMAISLFEEEERQKNGALEGGKDGNGETGPELDPKRTEAAGMDPAGVAFSEDGGITLLFGGDIYLSDHVLNAYDRAGGIDGVLDEGLRSEIGGADLFIANQEFPFSDRGAPAADKKFTFRLPSARISVMQEIGVDVVTLANNHTLDYGPEALLDTCMLLDQAGIVRVGAGANLDEAKKAEILEVRGKRIGFLAASRVYPDGSWAASDSWPGLMSTYDPAMLLEEIRALRPACDYLVVYVHWGIERNTAPEAYQKIMGRQYIDAGADLVVGSHPHVLQGIEYYKGKPILYSLGNFIFGSSIPETMLVKVELLEAEAGLRLIPAVSSAGYTRRMGEEKQGDFFSRMEGMSSGIRMEGDTVRSE